MIINVKYVDDGSWYDIKDYTIGSLNINFSTRELDYSINTSGPTIEISDNYDYEGNTAEDIEKIRIYENLSYFYGVPSKIEIDYRNSSTKISVFFPSLSLGLYCDVLAVFIINAFKLA